MIRRIATALIILGMVSPLAAQAQWTGPTQTPPSGNVSKATLTTVTTGSGANITSNGISIGSLINNGGSYFVGSVGIGTASPGNKLVVQTNEATAVNSKVADFTNNGANTYGSVYISVSRSPGSTNTTDIEQNSGGSGPFRYGTYSDTNIVNNGTAAAGSYQNINFVTNSAIRMSVAGGNLAGNVGISNTSPDAKLRIDKNTATLTSESDYAIKITDGSALAGLLLGTSNANSAGLIQSFDVGTGWTGVPLALQLNGGNVGIGTVSPGAKLEVAGQVKITGGTPGAGKVLTSDAAGLASWTTIGGGSIGGSGTTNYHAKFTGASTLGNSLVFDDGTNVGIGTTTPAEKFSVNGKVLLSDSASASIRAAMGYNIFSEAGYSLYTIGSGPLTFGTASQRRMVIDAAGNVGIGAGAVSPSSALVVGDNLSGLGGTKAMVIGSTNSSSFQYVGQDATHNVSTSWIYNATPASAFGQVQTYGRANPLYVDGSLLYLNTQSSAGNVSVGWAGGDQKLNVGGNIHVYNSGGTSQGYLYADGTGFGLLNNAGNWMLYSPAGSQTVFHPGAIGRTAHASGFLQGSYNNVAANDGKTNPIYTIGSSYNPSDTALGNMYGIGFSHSNFWGAGKSTGWGLYQASAGTVYNTISDGGIWSAATITSGGAMTAPAFYYSSDRTLKKNIAPLSDSLAKVTKLQGVSFDWKKDGKASVGLIAQDVEKVYPELVNTDKETGLKSVEYGNLVAPLIEAVKEQQKQIENQQKQIDLLKKEIEKLR